MTFTVTYRGADGEMREERVEATGRRECFAQCRARGIAPMSVKEGARSGKGAPSPKERCMSSRAVTAAWGRHPPKRKAVAYVSVALTMIIGGVWWQLGRSKSRFSPEPATPKLTAPVKGTVPAKPAAKPSNYGEGASSHSGGMKGKMERGYEAMTGVQDQGKTTATNDMMSDVVSDLRVDRSKVKPMFENAIHAELANYIQPGRDVPPPDRVSDEEALKAADTPIKYAFDDSMEILEQKKAVEDLLLEMREYIRNGGHANDFLDKLQQRQEMEGEAVSQIRRSVYDLIEKGDDTAAQEALDTYNRYLQGKGIPPVRIKRLERIKASGAVP